MAFGVQAIVESTTISLTDGAPFKLRHARGMAGPPIRRVTARGPAQHGDTDLGYRLQPREIELELLFHASSDSVLDGYRDDLVAVFKPLTATPVNLRVTRDDDEVRQIDVFTVGPIKIDLVPEERAAHLHRAVIRLRAPDPTWYDPVPGTASVQGTPNPNWWLAGGAIGTARVVMSGSVPGTNEAWSLSGTVGGTSTYTLAFAAVFESASSGYRYAFYPSNPAGANSNYGFFAYANGLFFAAVPDTGIENTGMAGGTANYFWRYDGSAGFSGGKTHAFQRATNTPVTLGTAQRSVSGGVWRGVIENTGTVPWQTAIPIYALYSPGLTDDELASVNTYMDNHFAPSSGTISRSTSVQLDGDMPDYPEIRITGPITDPYIFHVYTGHTLAFSHTIGAGTTWIIDLRHGYKTVLEGTVNRRGELTAISDLAEWQLSADFAQGSNAIVMGGTNVGTAAQLEIVYHHRYSSY